MHRFLAIALSFATVAPAISPVRAAPPVKIYVLVGQSNMQGKGAIDGEGSNTLRHLLQNDPRNEFGFLVGDDGEWVEREDVWIYLDQAPGESVYGGLKPGYGSSGGQIGPELGFGHVIGDATGSQVLLIKACWGGKSLGHNFLPPSVGQYPTPVMPGDPGFFYHEILRIVDQVTGNIDAYFPGYQGQGIEIAGLAYHQGWNDQYGGLDETYETNLAAFINDIRSSTHGLGVPGLPVVIASSGMIETPDSRVKQGQLAMADTEKYPQFAGNVSVVDTDKPYGPQALGFKFYTEKSPTAVGYHWNNHAHSYLNIGRAMAAEMQKLEPPTFPSRLVAHGSDDGVQLTWQLGSEKPDNIDIRRNGESLGVSLSPAQTAFVDTTAPPGANRYQLLIDLPSGRQVLDATSDTSVTRLTGYRSLQGVALSWDARGKYGGFRLSRDGEVIAANIPPDARTFEDRQAPADGVAIYAIQPTAGDSTPAEYSINLGSPDPGAALVYEPFDYPASATDPQSLIGKGGAPGTRGTYTYASDEKLERAPATLAGGLSYGTLPVTGNRGSAHRWSSDGVIALDDNLREAGLLEDGATLWMSFLFVASREHEHRQGGGLVTLRSADLKQGVGFKATGRQYETAVVRDGVVETRRITGTRPNTPTLVVGKVTWGVDGELDRFVPFHVGPDLELPEKEGRASVPFDIDQTALSRLVLSGEGQFDEIRVGATYESVVGGSP